MKQISFWVAIFTLLGLNIIPAVSAQSSSDNYRVEEVYFGVGGELETSSQNYRAQQSAGSLTSGNTSSENFDAETGFLTPSEPFLEAGLEATDVDFGTLSDSSTAFAAAQGGDCSCTFYVRSYLSSEYVVVSVSQPPTNESGDSIDAKTTLGAPNIGTEEFGFNLVDNATPDMGANPQNVPDDSFADGQAATGYDTADQFKYGVGDTIARSQATPGNPAIGRTNYTISYMMNISGITPAGLYQMQHDIVVVATF